MTTLPVSTTNSDAANLNQVNSLMREVADSRVTNVFKGPNNINALINGKLPNDLGYGFQFSDSDGVPRILGYIDANNNPKLRISESGIDVTTATNDQLTFNSDNNLFTIVDSGTAVVTLANPVTHFSTTETTVTHGLGYAPAFQVFCTVDPSLGGELIAAPFSGFDGTGAFAFSIKVRVTTTQIIFGVQPNAASAYDGTSWSFKYYLLQETAS